MDANEIIEKLQTQLDEVPLLQSADAKSPKFEKWHRKICNILERIPLKGDVYRKEFGTFRFHDFVATSPPNRKPEHTKCYQGGIRSAQTFLEAIIEEVKEYTDDFQEEIPNKQNALTIVENLCNRFHIFVRHLRIKHHENQTIEPIAINSEYDVQFLLQAILSLFFDDIRPEEPGATRAGSSSRADFWLFQEGIIVECKYIKPKLTREKLKEQLDKDLLDYRTKERCRAIIFFIYDPRSLIDNPRGFESGYNEIPIESLTIKTLVRPIGH